MTAEIGKVGEIRIWRVGIFATPVEEVVAGLVDDGNMHVTGIAWEAFARLRHEAGRDSVVGAQRFDNISKV